MHMYEGRPFGRPFFCSSVYADCVRRHGTDHVRQTLSENYYRKHAAYAKDGDRLRAQRTSAHRRPAQIPLSFAANLRRVVCLHGLSVGPRAHQFQTARGSAGARIYATWLRLFELQRYYSWIIDRFHISTRACQLQTRGKDYDFRWLEERLAALNFRLIFCARTEDSFSEARAARLPVSGKPSQYDDLSLFIREQELMRRLVSESLLQKHEVDVSDGNIPRICNAIADWLEGTGGLWAA